MFNDKNIPSWFEKVAAPARPITNLVAVDTQRLQDQRLLSFEKNHLYLTTIAA